MKIFSITGILLVFYSCKQGNQDVVPDVSGIEVDYNLIRIDHQILKIDTSKIDGLLFTMENQYPAFTKILMDHIIGIQDSSRNAVLNGFRNWLRDSLIQHTNKKIQIEFPEGDKTLKGLKQSLQFMKYYFPEEQEPVFYTVNSGLSYGNFIFQENNKRDGIGIGLDFFLGSRFDYNRVDPSNPAFSAYLNRAFNRDHLVKKTWEVWIEDRLPNPENGRLLDYIIHRGKKLYTLKKFIPALPDTVLFEFTPAQLKWCRENKVEMWMYFLNQNILYSTEFLKFNKYINPSPSSPGMPSDAPGQTGCFIGLQIIEAYLKKHPDISLSQLWALTDSQAILNASKFKPRNE